MSYRETSLPFWKTDVLVPKEERGCRKMIYWGEGTYARETDHAQLDWPARREAAAGSRRTGWLPWVRSEGLCLWEKALGVASSCLQCPSWSVRFMGPNWLSQRYHLLPPQSLGMKKCTHVIVPYSASNSQCWTTSSFCPLASALRSAWVRANWSVRPTSTVCQGGNFKVFPRFWWGFLRDKVKKWSTRQAPISSCIGCSGSVCRIHSKYFW